MGEKLSKIKGFLSSIRKWEYFRMVLVIVNTVIGFIIIWFMGKHYPQLAQVNPEAKRFLDDIRRPLLIVGYIFAFGGIAFFAVKVFLDLIWESLIGPTIIEGFDKLSNIPHKLKIENMPSRRDYVEKRFGTHSKASESFCNHLLNVYGEAFCNQPLRHDLNTDITITQDPNNSEYFRWRDKSTSKIVIPDWREGAVNTKIYPIRLYTSTFAPDMSISDWLKEAKLSAKLDGTELIHGQPKQVSDNKHHEKYWVHKDEKWIRMGFEEDIHIDKKEVSFVTLEECLSHKEDFFFCCSQSSPVLNHTLEMTLPKEYEFVQDTDGSQHCLFDGLPNGIKGERERKDFFEVTKPDPGDEHKLWAKSHGWNVPGINFFVMWRKKGSV
ncbi:MAG TPA: hypothetical protein DCS48_14790 [Desulfovibrio sp.]|nr:hypothetical protein [Desulfovibrio sp.]